MAKSKLNRENMWENDAVRGILFLLSNYDQGLEQKHFRYILEENYATPEQIKNDPQVANNVKKLEEFFSKDFNRLKSSSIDGKTTYFIFLQTKGIGKGCIKSRSHLNYYLDILMKPPLEVIESKSEVINHKYVKNHKTKYFIKPEFLGEAIRMQNKNKFAEYDSSNILSFKRKFSPTHVIYGISQKMFDSFTDKEKEEIKENLDKITNSLVKIDVIRDKKSERDYNRILEKITKKFKNKNLNNFLTKNPGLMVFFQEYMETGGNSLLELLEKKFKSTKGENSDNKTLVLLFDNYIKSVYEIESPNISFEEKVEFLKMCLNNNDLKNMIPQYCPHSISYSFYMPLIPITRSYQVFLDMIWNRKIKKSSL